MPPSHQLATGEMVPNRRPDHHVRGMDLDSAIRFRPPARGNAGLKGERRVGHRLRELGVPVLHGAFVADGAGERELDLLALLGGWIWVVEVKSSLGHPPRRIGPALAEAARVQLRRQMAALARALPGAELSGVVVFSERVRIEPPVDGVTTLEGLADLVAGQGGAPSAATLEGWRRLCAARG